LNKENYTTEQIAGVLGNLKQEHNFNTSDTPNGLGIAQWTGSRRAKLISNNYPAEWISTQALFLAEELNTTEKKAQDELRATQTVEQATIAFQNSFERCGDCRTSQRLNYANDYLNTILR